MDDTTLQELQELLADESATEPDTVPVDGDQPQPLTDREKELLAKARHWREKAKRAEASARPVANPQQIDPSQFATKDELVDVQLDRQGFDPDTAALIKTYAKGAGKSPLAVLEDDAIKDIIEQRKKKASLANATPPASDRSLTADGKQWGEMDETERRKNFDSVRRKFLGK